MCFTTYLAFPIFLHFNKGTIAFNYEMKRFQSYLFNHISVLRTFHFKTRSIVYISLPLFLSDRSIKFANFN
uniref:Uncharacterized protein n=1 Tax=Lepeophtheirus salmonis TaxID=72036 RepID=A0A0K2V2B3_LEPSM